MKKLIPVLGCMILVLVLLLSSCSNYAPKKNEPSENLELAERADGESYYVKGIGTCTDTEVVIPSTYQGKPVTMIGDSAFSRCGNITSVTIPDGVIAIGNSAFSYCSNLKEIRIPDSVMELGENVFFNCDSLTSITLPNSLRYTTMKTFGDCPNLKSIFIPSGANGIIPGTFWGCSNLETITVAEGHPFYKSVGNCLIDTATKTLIAGCKTSVIPTDGSVLRIGELAFAGCTNLTSIVIPEGVLTIERMAFLECTFENITLPCSLGIIDQAFLGCMLKSITYPGTKHHFKTRPRSSVFISEMLMENPAFVIHCTDGDIDMSNYN